MRKPTNRSRLRHLYMDADLPAIPSSFSRIASISTPSFPNWCSISAGESTSPVDEFSKGPPLYSDASPRHLWRYVDEAAFKYSFRHVDDGARLRTLVRAAEGKRLANRTSSPL